MSVFKDYVNLILTADTQDAQQDIQKTVQELDKLNKQVEVADKKQDEWTKSISKTNDELKEAKQVSEGYNNELKEQAKVVDAAAAKAKFLNQEYSDYKKTLQATEKEITSYTKLEAKATKAKQVAEAKLAVLNTTTADGKKKQEQYNNTIQTAEAAISLCTKELSKLNEARDEEAQDLVFVEMYWKKANVQLEEATDLYEEIKKDVKAANTEVESLNRSVDKQTKSLDDWARKSNEATDELKKLNQEVDDATNVTNVLSGTISELSNKFGVSEKAIQSAAQALGLYDRTTGEASVSGEKLVKVAADLQIKHDKLAHVYKNVSDIASNLSSKYKVLDKATTTVGNAATYATSKFTTHKNTLKTVAPEVVKSTNSYKGLEATMTKLSPSIDKVTTKIKGNSTASKIAASAQKALSTAADMATIQLSQESKTLSTLTTNLNKAASASKTLASTTKTLGSATLNAGKSMVMFGGRALAVITVITGLTQRYNSFITGVNNAHDAFIANFDETDESIIKLEETLTSMFGLTEAEFEKTITQLKTQAENYGMNAEEATNFAAAATTLTAVLAANNTQGLSYTQVAERVIAAMRGEAEGAEAVQVALSATSMQAYIEEQERFGIACDTTWASLSAEEQMVLRLSAGIEQAAITMGLTVEPITDMESALAALTEITKASAEGIDAHQKAMFAMKNAVNELLLSLEPLVKVLTGLLAVVIAVAAVISTAVIGALTAFTDGLVSSFQATIANLGAQEELTNALIILKGWWDQLWTAINNVAAALGQAFGTAAAIAITAISYMIIAIDELVAKFTSSEVGQSIENNLTIVAGGLSAFFTQVGEGIRNGLTIFTEAFGLAFDQIAMDSEEFTTNLSTGLSTAFEGIALGLTTFFTDVGGTIATTLELSAGRIGNTLGLVAGTFQDFLGGISVGLGEAVGAWGELLGQFAANRVQSIANKFSDILATFTGFIDGFLTTIQPLLDRLQDLINIFTDIATTVAEILTPPLEWLHDNVLVPLQPVVEKLAYLFGTVLGGALGVLMSILDPVLAVLENILGIIQRILDPIQRMTDAIFAIIEPMDIFAGICDTINGFLDSMITLVQNVTTAISDFMHMVGDDLANGGFIDIIEWGSQSANATMTTTFQTVGAIPTAEQMASQSFTVSGQVSKPTMTLARLLFGTPGINFNQFVENNANVDVNVQGRGKSLQQINREARILAGTRGVTW